MKRPEGFDPPTPEPTTRARPQVPPRGVSEKRQSHDATESRRPVRSAGRSRPESAGRAAKISPARTPVPDAAARGALKRTARDRRRAERMQAKRFTRRARTRRAALGVVAGVLATLVALIFVAIYSPLLALRTITIDGASRVSPDEIRSAVDGQLGTPLALIDFSRMTRELAAFPLIRSYVTQTIPPGTLIIHIVERQPVGAIVRSGVMQLVDPAGVVVAESTELVPGVPVIEVANGDTSSAAFDSVVQVLLALPPNLLAQVATVSASTQDDVSLVLTGVGQSVTWGSADESARKAALLAALITATDPNQPGVFDVSAPSNGVFRPL